MQNNFGPTGSPAGIFEHTIGKAYAAVQTVSDNLETIKTIAANIAAIKDAARNMARKILVVEGNSAALGATAYVQLPEGVTEDLVVDSQVAIIGSDTAIYSESSGHFSSKIVAGYLEVLLDAAAPAALANADIRWTLSYQD
jgi:hypothetical protein